MGGCHKPCGKDVCGPCVTCPKHKVRVANSIERWTHFGRLSNNIQTEVLKKHCDIKDDQCICNACRLRYTNRANGKIVHTPKKREEGKNIEGKVCVLKDQTDIQCHETNFHLLTYSSDQIFECFNTLVQVTHDTPQHICHTHYMKIYNQLQVMLCECCTFPISGQNRTTNSLHSASLAFLNSIHNTRLTTGNTICSTCWLSAYKYGKAASTLVVLEQELHDNIDSINNENTSNENVPSRSLPSTFLHIVYLFRNNRAILLKDIYEYYCDQIDKKFGSDPILCIKEKKTCRWFLSSVVAQFGKIVKIHIMQTDGQTNFKGGTMLVYAMSDDMQALHHALAVERQARLRYQSYEREFQTKQTADEINHCRMLHYLGTALNKTLGVTSKINNL